MSTEKDLIDRITSTGPWDAIVVEGYDGVGKGRVLTLLSNLFSVEPYRPDYNLWNQFDHRYADRWKVSGFFWDVYSHFMKGTDLLGSPLLFDRGVLSGAVYNHDDSIARCYKTLLRDMKVLHILVICSEADYRSFADIRGSELASATYDTCLRYSDEYLRMMELAGVDYYVYENQYDPALAERLSNTCEGCGHYSYGICRHPKINARVEYNCRRCSLASDKEVQDVNDDEVHVV